MRREIWNQQEFCITGYYLKLINSTLIFIPSRSQIIFIFLVIDLTILCQIHMEKVNQPKNKTFCDFGRICKNKVVAPECKRIKNLANTRHLSFSIPNTWQTLKMANRQIWIICYLYTYPLFRDGGGSITSLELGQVGWCIIFWLPDLSQFFPESATLWWRVINLQKSCLIKLP